MIFQEKLNEIVTKRNSLVCIGLDTDVPDDQFVFNKGIIDATNDIACAYKPNTAFYEARGVEGIKALKRTCDYIRETHDDILIILDAKRGDIGNTNQGYVTFAFDYLGADAITLNPYMGKEALMPFLERKEKGSFILCKTSNQGSGEFQDEMYQKVAEHVSGEWNKNGNCALVVGATYPTELEIVRRIVGEIPILIPGIGAQGGDIEKIVKTGVDRFGRNAIINASRSIIFSQDPRKEAEKLRDDINQWRTK